MNGLHLSYVNSANVIAGIFQENLVNAVSIDAMAPWISRSQLSAEEWNKMQGYVYV